MFSCAMYPLPSTSLTVPSTLALSTPQAHHPPVKTPRKGDQDKLVKILSLIQTLKRLLFLELLLTVEGLVLALSKCA